MGIVEQLIDAQIEALRANLNGAIAQYQQSRADARDLADGIAELQRAKILLSMPSAPVPTELPGEEDTFEDLPIDNQLVMPPVDDVIDSIDKDHPLAGTDDADGGM